MYALSRIRQWIFPSTPTTLATPNFLETTTKFSAPYSLDRSKFISIIRKIYENYHNRLMTTIEVIVNFEKVKNELTKSILTSSTISPVIVDLRKVDLPEFTVLSIEVLEKFIGTYFLELKTSCREMLGRELSGPEYKLIMIPLNKLFTEVAKSCKLESDHNQVDPYHSPKVAIFSDFESELRKMRSRILGVDDVSEIVKDVKVIQLIQDFKERRAQIEKELKLYPQSK